MEPRRGRGRPKLLPEQKKTKPKETPEPKMPVYKDAQSPEWYENWVKEKVAYNEYIETHNLRRGAIQTFVGERVFRFD
jgi:hypothetical protein